MKDRNKIIVVIIIPMILTIISFSAYAHYRYERTWTLALVGSILYMGIVFISSYLKKYENKILYFLNNIISIAVMYFIMGKILLDEGAALMIITIYIFSTSQTLNNFFKKQFTKRKESGFNKNMLD